MIFSLSVIHSVVAVQLALKMAKVIRILACLVFTFACPNQCQGQGQNWNWNWSDPSYMGWNYSNSQSSHPHDPMWTEECRPTSKSSPSKYSDLSKQYRKCGKQFEKSKQKRHPLVGKDTQEIVKFYGYPSEVHKVMTKDGYKIKLHRIPSNGTSVLLWHGLGGCSDNWVFNGPTQSLAFVLANQGFDVWLGNSRGSTHSLGHKRLSPHDINYWDFRFDFKNSGEILFHENGMFDLPASIKRIRKKNGNKPIFYVGNSQGTTNFMVGASTKPATNMLNKGKILAAFLLAPAGFLGRFPGVSRAAMPLLANPITGKFIWTAFGGRLESRQKFEKFTGMYLGNVCSSKELVCGVCSIPVLAVSGFDASLTNYSNIPHLADKNPNNLNIKSLLHYAQSVTSCKFRQFDYGPWENRQRYGNDYPPDYELKNINVPTYIYWGQKDGSCAPEDIKRTKDAFKKKIVKGFIRVAHDSFNHADFVLAKRVKELLYDQIVSEMHKLKPK